MPVSALSMVTVARQISVRDSPPRVFGATWLRLWSNQTVMRGPREIRWGQHFHHDIRLAPSWPGQPLLAAGHSRSYGAVIKNPPRQHLAPSIFYLIDWPPRLSHVSHVIPEPAPRYGHANYGPGKGYSLQRAGGIICGVTLHCFIKCL